jgi:hypothetical protein
MRNYKWGESRTFDRTKKKGNSIHMRNLPKQKVASACKNNRIMKANIENS